MTSCTELVDGRYDEKLIRVRGQVHPVRQCPLILDVNNIINTSIKSYVKLMQFPFQNIYKLQNCLSDNFTNAQSCHLNTLCGSMQHERHQDAKK